MGWRREGGGVLPYRSVSKCSSELGFGKAKRSGPPQAQSNEGKGVDKSSSLSVKAALGRSDSSLVREDSSVSASLKGRRY